MRLSLKNKSYLMCLALSGVALATAPAAKASLATQVLSAVGPTTAINYYTVNTGGQTYVGGPGNGLPNLVNTSFSISGMQIYMDGNTDIVDQFGNDDEGVFSLNIDTAHPSNDFLVEQIDFGSGVGSPTGLETIFNSTKLLGFGAAAGFPGEYWFAFQQSSPGTPMSPNGAIIGGVWQTNADIKVLSVTSPTPSAALGGMTLIVGLAGWRMARRLVCKAV
jgi:hypothetical protein